MLSHSHVKIYKEFKQIISFKDFKIDFYQRIFCIVFLRMCFNQRNQNFRTPNVFQDTSIGKKKITSASTYSLIPSRLCRF